MNWSLSKLGTFQKCRRRFLYAYIRNLKRPTAEAAQRGVDKHAIIENHFKEGTPLPDELNSYENWFSMLRQFEHYSENKLAMRKGWLPCTWEDPEVWWKGVLDLKVLDGHKAWVFDWKTGKIYPDHEDQKELYAIAVFVEHEDVDTIEAWHIYLDLGKNTSVTYHRDDLPKLITKWNAKLVPYMQAVELYTPESAETFFVTNPSYLCNYCPYSKNPCPH